MPVAISYEYDPNDYLKAREFLLRKRDPEFKKSQRDDLFSMETGLLQQKGHVHLSLTEPMNPHIDAIAPDASEAVRSLTSSTFASCEPIYVSTFSISDAVYRSLNRQIWTTCEKWY